MSRTQPTDVSEFDIPAFETFLYQGNSVDPNHVEKLVRNARRSKITGGSLSNEGSLRLLVPALVAMLKLACDYTEVKRIKIAALKEEVEQHGLVIVEKDQEIKELKREVEELGSKLQIVRTAVKEQFWDIMIGHLASLGF